MAELHSHLDLEYHEERLNLDKEYTKARHWKEEYITKLEKEPLHVDLARRVKKKMAEIRRPLTLWDHLKDESFLAV